MIAIELKDASIKYGTKYALQDINLNIEAGCIVGIIGPSGSGKTTILRVIAGFQKSNSGDVKLFGNNVYNVEPAERNIGYIFQNYSLFPHLSVFENISFGLKVRNIKKDEIQSRVETVTEFLSIQNLLKKYPHQLSGGEQQRVAIARAMILEPKILLLDESFSSLDYSLKMELLNQLKRIDKQMGTTILYVTHDQTDCFGLCDKIVIVKDGRILEEDNTKNILNNPKSKEVATFLGVYQSLDNQIVKNIESKFFEFTSNQNYFIRKNKFNLHNSHQCDLSITGTVSEVINKSLYYLVKLNINDNVPFEFVAYLDKELKPNENISLFFESKDLIIYENEEIYS